MNHRRARDESLLDIIADLKDRVIELEHTREHQQDTQPQSTEAPRVLSPDTQPNEPWTPCTPEEVAFYGSLQHYA